MSSPSSTRSAKVAASACRHTGRALPASSIGRCQQQCSVGDPMHEWRTPLARAMLISLILSMETSIGLRRALPHRMLSEMTPRPCMIMAVYSACSLSAPHCKMLDAHVTVQVGRTSLKLMSLLRT